ncbi:alpha/beta hydrolase [Nioella nitratireducens]|uniref:alpha/beta hydrolase n=1 Tax=Nioella nitratireducens TaxID=1287720 RepID=UPI0008FCF97D|nr:alpha/beta hydrolase [Nioella nitratireducens]
MLVALTARADRLEGEARLRAALRASPAAVATVMIHGYRFCPDGPDRDNPHRHILSLDPVRDCWKAVSWPRHLHMDRGGLGIALGWPAQGTLAGAYRRAGETGAALARIARIVRQERPTMRLTVMAHSLGARVALAALPLVGAGDIARMVLLSGAEYRQRAAMAMDSPAGHAVRVLNVTSGENAPFDAAFRLLIRPDGWADWPIGAGLQDPRRNWLNLSIDCPRHHAALRQCGFPMRPPRTRFCHWSGYMRPGVFALYRAVLGPDGATALARLGAALPDGQSEGTPRPEFATGPQPRRI